MAHRPGTLMQQLSKILSLPPREAVRRIFARAARFSRRLRNARRVTRLTDSDLLSALITPSPTVAELVGRRRESQPLVPASRQCDGIARRIAAEAPRTFDPILGAARSVVEGTFDLLGSGPVNLGPDPDWHADFKSGRRWGLGYSLAMAPVPDQGHDVKVPWELSRLQHLVVLGLASTLSGDPSYRERGVLHIASFIAKNPVYRGVNWSCTMDVAIRAAQILVAEGYLLEAGDERFWGEAIKSLLLHGRFIGQNLEDGPIRGNHYVADLAGLFLCGLGLPEFREAQGWREFAVESLCSEMHRQVTPDGLDYEASLSYHAFVTEMFLFPALLASEKGRPFPRPYLDRLERMLEAVAILMRPDGTLPQIGDNDDGRFLIVSQYHRSRRDWKPLLALGAYMFRRPEWLAQAGDAWVEGAWLLGDRFLDWRAAAQSSPSIGGFRCHAFSEAGVYQLATGDMQMVVDAGPVGQGNNGGHAHNDTLAFDLYAFGREVLPDRGTGIYTPDVSLRNRFRSTLSHNTVQIDGEEINPIPAEPFSLRPADAPRVIGWRVGERYACLVAEHKGYQRLSSGAVHRRSVLLDRSKGTFHIQDRIEGGGRHHYLASFHLAPGWSVSLADAGWTARSPDGVSSLSLTWRRRPGGSHAKVEDDLHSDSYGVTRPARTVRVSWTGEAPCRLRYALSVRSGGPA